MWAIGALVQVIRDIDISPYAMIKVGEFGTVVAFFPDTKEITIELFNYHAGLGLWHNTIWCLWPYIDDISTALKLVTDRELIPLAEDHQEVLCIQPLVYGSL
jgi:hypothetical protein